ncbi:hypothetical protein ARMGADRAFT_741426 [Armillaria gallica]|uniref:Uncharacterized protein n=1 Tax=Armillaria gallica TaxID=47427 RepID=A0A2H3CLL6_ARMGA|nr:hypothetical protein ARMGADRAFT_741426 [Armillaria gallica]
MGLFSSMTSWWKKVVTQANPSLDFWSAQTGHWPQLVCMIRVYMWYAVVQGHHRKSYIILQIDLSIIDHISPPSQRPPTCQYVLRRTLASQVRRHDPAAAAEGPCRIWFLLNTHTVHSSSCCCISSPNQGDIYLKSLLSPSSFLELALRLIIQCFAFCLTPTLRYWSPIALPPRCTIHTKPGFCLHNSGLAMTTLALRQVAQQNFIPKESNLTCIRS